MVVESNPNRASEGANAVRTHILTYLVLFAIVDLFIPIPIMATLLIYVVIRRPRWFLDYVADVYRDR